MSDRELLELAAKAAEIVVRWHSNGYYGATMEIMEDEAGGPPWNPLTDDGDALRLAVKLRFNVNIEESTVDVYNRDLNLTRVWASEVPDINEATRRAIVRAAAEIGRTL